MAKVFSDKPMVALCNTLSGVDEMTKYQPDLTKDELKAKYGVKQDVIFIFCARFTADRRVDLFWKQSSDWMIKVWLCDYRFWKVQA